MFRRKPVPDSIGDGHRLADQNTRHSTTPEHVPLPKERDMLQPGPGAPRYLLFVDVLAAYLPSGQ
jgi:hypothetical protein